MIYSVINYNHAENEDPVVVITTEFCDFLKQAKEYARKVFDKPTADGLVRMLPALEVGEVRRIEVNLIVFRVTEVEGE